MLEYFRDLIAYTAWADSEFFRIWNAVPGLREDSSLRTRTDHLVSVQFAFLYAIQDQTYQFRASNAPLPDLAALQERSSKAHGKWQDLISGLSPVDLEKPIRVSWFRSIPVQPTYGEAITQAVMHTQHHRAQNMVELGPHRNDKTVLDYIVWVINNRPAAKWELNPE